MTHYKLEGHTPVECNDYSCWEQNRTVAKTNIGEILISTVFLCINHRFGDGGPPILFETMIFGGQYDQYQQRYETWEQAEAGHEAAVKMVTLTG